MNHFDFGTTGWRVFEIGLNARGIGSRDWGGADQAEWIAALRRRVAVIARVPLVHRRW